MQEISTRPPVTVEHCSDRRPVPALRAGSLADLVALAAEELPVTADLMPALDHADVDMVRLSVEFAVRDVPMAGHRDIPGDRDLEIGKVDRLDGGLAGREALEHLGLVLHPAIRMAVSNLIVCERGELRLVGGERGLAQFLDGAADGGVVRS